MRWLLIDAGNTALKWEVFTASTVQWPGSRTGAPAATRWQGILPIDSSDLGIELARACAAASALTGSPVPSAVLGCAVTSEPRVRAIADYVSRARFEAGVAEFVTGPLTGYLAGRPRSPGSNPELPREPGPGLDHRIRPVRRTSG